MNTVVVRFSSLGDIVLSAGITHALAPVTYVTSSAYRSLVETFPGVDSVCVPSEDPLPVKAKKIVDLHGNWRSFWICKQIQGTTHQLKRYDWLRRSRVWFKSKERPPSVLQRYAEAANVTPSQLPWLSRKSSGPCLLICPTTRHATKQWPFDRFVEIGKLWDGPVVLLGSADDKRVLNDMVDQIGSKATIVAEKGFSKTFDVLNNAAMAVGLDSGLSHLCTAFGIPTLVIMGPTTKHDGFWSHTKSTTSIPLYCRPCSRFGSGHCPIGDHQCMEKLTTKQVWQELQKLKE